MRLLERDHDLAALNGWLDDVAAGHGRIVLVFGEAGIGKTALLRAFAQEHGALGQGRAKRVLWGGCEALFTPHPLAPLYDIARQIGGPLLAQIDGAARRDTLFALTLEQLAGLAAPTVVIVEDVHWADEATLDLLKFLGRRLRDLGVMLIATYRDDELGGRHGLRSVLGDLPASSVRRLHLPPLSPEAVAALAEAADRGATGQGPGNLHAITGGNPFFVTEALASAERAVPATVRDAVIARVARLPEAARAIADAVALVPGRIERWLLDAVTPSGDGGIGDAAIQDCLGAGMIALPDGALAFRHELARRAVEEDLPLPRRQSLHRRILEALRAHDTAEIPIARLVHHADLAGDGKAVLRFAPRAAQQAARLRSHREAAAHYATALRHAAALPGEERARMGELRSYECYLTDQVEDAIKARVDALGLWRAAGDRLKEGDNARWLSRLSWFRGNKAVADRYAAEAVAILEALPPGRELAMAYSNRAQLGMLADDLDEALAWGEKAIALATSLDDREILSHALNNVGSARMLAGQAGEAEVERALTLALDGGYEEHAARAYTNLGTSLARHYDLPRAIRYLHEGIAYCEEHDLDAWVRYMRPFRAWVQFCQGDWTQAAEEAEAIIRHPSVAPVSKITALVVLGLVRARRGDPDAETPLDEALALARPTGELQRIGFAVAARAEAAWLRGELAATAEEIRAAWEIARRGTDPWMAGSLAVWLQRCDEKIASPSKLAPSCKLTGPFALQAAGKWRAAAEAWEGLGCPYEQAAALADGDDESSLRQALEICERLGAAALGAIVRRTLRASGVRGVARGPQERTRKNPQGLTNRELKVLALLTEGCRNAEIARRLFVSEKTVDHHVSAILGKLAVRSRGEAAAAANRLGLVGATRK